MYLRVYLQLILLIGLFMLSGHLYALSLNVDDIHKQSPQNLIEKLRYASEKDCEGFDAKTIKACPSLQILNNASLSLGYTAESHWLVFSLANTSPKPRGVYIELSNPLLDSIEFYAFDGNDKQIARFTAGDTYPFSQRTIQHPNFVFPMEIPGNDVIEFSLRIRSDSAFQVPIFIWQAEQFSGSKFKEFLLFGFFIGAMLVLAIYNLVMSIVIRDKSYFFCATTLFLYALVMGNLLGINFALLWPESTQWNQVSVIVFDLLALASLAVLAQTFLLMKKPSINADRWLSVVATICVLVALSVPFVPYYYLIMTTSLLAAIVPIIATFKSVLLWREGLFAARYFVFAFAFFAFAVSVFLSSKFGIVPRSLITEYAIHFGAVVVVICLSLAVADQFNHELKQKDEAQTGSIKALKKFKEIYTHSSEGIFRLNQDGGFASVNPKFLDMMGAANIEDLKAKFPDLGAMVHDDLGNILAQIKSQESTLNLDLSCQRVDGSQIWVTLNTRLYWNGTGQLESIEGSMIDISARKAAENQLQEALLSLNESVKAGNIGIWDCDLQTNAVRFSKEYKEQLGYTEDEFKNEYNEWESRVHPEDIQKTLGSIRQSIKECSKNHESLFRIKHKDGTYRWILSHASVIQGENGRAIRMIGSHVDITDRKNLEEELRHSQKMEAVGHLAGGVAHDFNNLLAIIMGFAELLEHKLSDAELSGYAAKIISSAEHSRNLINQLLTFSRKQSLHLESMDIHQQLNEVIELLSRSIDKRINIVKTLSAQHTKIMADKSLVQNAFLNLGLNARDAMPEGGTIFITTELVDAKEIKTIHGNLSNATYVEIKFKDTGCGMSESIQSRIFEPFFTTKEIGKGTGMGLASVYGAIEQLSGSIVVNSKIDVGSCFTIYLPLIEKQQELSRQDAISKFDKSQQAKTILVVDDELLIRELCHDFLSILGHQGLFASDGIEAIKIYSQNWQHIDLVILDMMMPVMGGKEVFEAFLKINPNVKVIIASGYTADNSFAEMIELGVAKTMNKPFNLSSLELSINAVTAM